MKVMIYATAPWIGSGYGLAARNVGQVLTRRGYDVAYFAWNSVRGVISGWEGIPVYPAGASTTGHDVLSGHVKHFGADVLLTICDPWIVNDPNLWSDNHEAKVIHWHPCQADPASIHLVKHIKAAHMGLNYSQWGTRVMRESGLKNVRYAPLGVDTEIYRPLDVHECKQWLSERIGIDLTDKYMVTIVAANASTLPIMRKNFDGQMMAFARFLGEYEPNAVMYIHTSRHGYPSGIDLQPLMDALNLRVGKEIFFPSHWNYTVGLDGHWMNKLYNATDVLSMATLGEGFGLPVLEALATGTPVVTSDFSSLIELSVYGYKAKLTGVEWVPGQIAGFIGRPDVQDIVNGYRAVWDENDQVFGSPSTARDFAEQMSWQNCIAEFLIPVLEDANGE